MDIGCYLVEKRTGVFGLPDSKGGKWENIIYQKGLKILKALEYASIARKINYTGLLLNMVGFYLIKKQAKDINVNNWRNVWIIRK